MLVAFDRIEKAWMTINGGGDDERIEWPEIDWSLVDYPRRSNVVWPRSVVVKT